MYLNSKSENLALLTAFTIAGFGAVPPCMYKLNPAITSPSIPAIEMQQLSSSEYNLILFLRPGLRVDVVRLAVIWLSAIVAGGALVIASADGKDKRMTPAVR